jgi:hypothetical protein
MNYNHSYLIAKNFIKKENKNVKKNQYECKLKINTFK